MAVFLPPGPVQFLQALGLWLRQHIRNIVQGVLAVQRGVEVVSELADGHEVFRGQNQGQEGWKELHLGIDQIVAQEDSHDGDGQGGKEVQSKCGGHGHPDNAHGPLAEAVRDRIDLVLVLLVNAQHLQSRQAQDCIHEPGVELAKLGILPTGAIPGCQTQDDHEEDEQGQHEQEDEPGTCILGPDHNQDNQWDEDEIHHLWQDRQHVGTHLVKPIHQHGDGRARATPGQSRRPQREDLVLNTGPKFGYDGVGTVSGKTILGHIAELSTGVGGQKDQYRHHQHLEVLKVPNTYQSQGQPIGLNHHAYSLDQGQCGQQAQGGPDSVETEEIFVNQCIILRMRSGPASTAPLPPLTFRRSQPQWPKGPQERSDGHHRCPAACAG